MAIRTLSLAPTLDTNAYATGDLMGAAILSVAANASKLKLNAIVVTDLAKQSAAFDIIFLKGAITTTTLTDNAAADIDDVDLPLVIGAVSVPAGAYFALNDSSFAVVKDINLNLELTGSTLYALLVSRGSPTYAAADMTIRLVCE